MNGSVNHWPTRFIKKNNNLVLKAVCCFERHNSSAMALFGTISDGEIKQKPVINKYITAK